MRTARLPVAVLLAAAPAWAQAPEANYDEAKVPAYTLPDPLRSATRTAVGDAGAWRERRRPELLRLFEENVYGRSPGPPPAMRFVVVESDPRALGGLATRKQVRVLLDESASGPAFEILLYVPNGAPRPVPAFLGLNFDGNHAVHPDTGIRLSTAWMDAGPGVAGNRATEAARGTNAAIAGTVDVICLAQVSMALARAAVQARVKVPVLTSPATAVTRLRILLGG